MKVTEVAEYIPYADLEPEQRAIVGSKSADDRCSAAERGWALEFLCADADEYVRFKVAMNPVCPAEVLARVAADPSTYVRAAVAENKNTSRESLARLSEIRENAGSDDRGERFIGRCWDYVIYENIIRNPNCSMWMIFKLLLRSLESERAIDIALAEIKNRMHPKRLARR